MLTNSIRNNPLINLPSIYDSAIDADNWGGTLEASAQTIGAKGALILIVDQVADSGFQVGHYSNIWTRAPERAAMYNQKYAHYEKPVWEALHAKQKQSLILSTEFWADAKDIRSRPDYKFLSEAVGICHKCAARLNDNKSWFDTLVVHFDDALDEIPQAAVDGINALIPHVAKSIELGRAFNLLRASHQAVLTALDYVDIGLCIALPDGTVIVHNEEAARILDMNDGLTLGKDRHLKCRDTNTRGLLCQSLDDIGKTAGGANNCAESLFAIKRPSGKHDLLIELAPLRDFTAELEKNLHGSLITIIDPENSAPVEINKLAYAYQLSTAEADVCRYLIDGWNNSAIAEVRGVGAETIKSQVNSILRKTDTRRRSELIRLALRTSPPIRSSR